MATASGKGWEAAEVLEALGASDCALWFWDPRADRLRLTGALGALGLSGLGPECSSAELLAVVRPEDRHGAEDLLAPRPSGHQVAAHFRARGVGPSIWRGEWLEEGVRASGVVAPAARFTEGRFDALTGMLDRRGFIVRASETLAPADGEKIMIVANVNRFRRLNEALGHECGDMVLAALGARLAAAFPSETVMGRVGNDDFAVLVDSRVGDSVGVLRAALQQPLRIAGFDIFPTLSIGAARAQSGRDSPSAGDLLNRAADAARRTRSTAPAEGASNSGLSRLELEADLHGAIERGEIVPYFQPIVRLATGELAGFEALARWLHRRKGLMYPDIFLGAMGEMGMMPALGAHLTRAAAAQLAAWRVRHPAVAGITVSVNVSPPELDQPGLVEDIATIIASHGLPPGALKLELTESDIMRDPDSAAIILASLREAGAGLALDDFGTGFSSLSYLARLPFDTLKIDGYFVRTMATNAGSSKIVRSVVELGRALCLEVVAEGVEDAVMARDLMDLGCHYGQGFGYSPALSAEEAEVYLNESYADGAAPLKATR